LKQPTRRNLNPNPPLTPEGCGTQQSEAERLWQENAILRQRCTAQTHALHELNKAIVFALKNLGAPLRVRDTATPARKMRKAQ
jgi:hypothetical protein